MRLADPEITLIAKANAGIPKLVNGTIVYDGTPDVMAEYAVNAYRSGACLVGGCCGSSPQHIKAIADSLASVGGETSV
jgi:5-methyltetrahydrofolate--homocysteine methyltransferase